MNRKRGLQAAGGLIAALVLLGAALVALLGGWSGGEGTGSRLEPGGRPAPQIETRGPQQRAWGPAVGFASRERLDEHYRKHGAEFGSISREQYLRQAQALRDAPVGGPILEAVRGDGVITRFDRRNGAFLAVNPNGVIRTYFRPHDGERYFLRQLERER